MERVKKFVLLCLMTGFFSITGIYAQSYQASCGYKENTCYAPKDDYKHQFSRINTSRERARVKGDINDNYVINHNYKQQAGGNLLSAPGVYYGNRQSEKISDENIQGVAINHNYKQQAGSPKQTPGNEVVISETVDRGC